jgi:hypothetical protein
VLAIVPEQNTQVVTCGGALRVTLDGRPARCLNPVEVLSIVEQATQFAMYVGVRVALDYRPVRRFCAVVVLQMVPEQVT